jgi:hypothetical protein
MTLALGGVAACSGAAVGEDAGPCPQLVGHKARFIGPHDVVTMDYDPERANIYHDDELRITRITWG